VGHVAARQTHEGHLERHPAARRRVQHLEELAQRILHGAGRAGAGTFQLLVGTMQRSFNCILPLVGELEHAKHRETSRICSVSFFRARVSGNPLTMASISQGR